jgi:hypothetical protein
VRGKGSLLLFVALICLFCNSRQSVNVKDWRFDFTEVKSEDESVSYELEVEKMNLEHLLNKEKVATSSSRSAISETADTIARELWSRASLLFRDPAKPTPVEKEMFELVKHICYLCLCLKFLTFRLFVMFRRKLVFSR